MDAHIDADRLKLYALLAGTLTWESSTCLINACSDLDWKRALALHYWHSPAKVLHNPYHLPFRLRPAKVLYSPCRLAVLTQSGQGTV